MDMTYKVHVYSKLSGKSNILKTIKTTHSKNSKDLFWLMDRRDLLPKELGQLSGQALYQ